MLVVARGFDELSRMLFVVVFMLNTMVLCLACIVQYWITVRCREDVLYSYPANTKPSLTI